MRRASTFEMSGEFSKHLIATNQYLKSIIFSHAAVFSILLDISDMRLLNSPVPKADYILLFWYLQLYKYVFMYTCVHAWEEQL